MKSSVRRLGLLLISLLSASAWAATGSELLAAGRMDEAIAVLQSQPNDAPSQNLLCRAYYNLQNWDRAVDACARATRLAPADSWYHLWLGRAYGERSSQSNFVTAAGLAKKVKAEFERAVELDPQNAPARSDLAEFYLQAPAIMGGGADKALAQAQALLKLDSALGRRMMGRIAEKERNFSQAEQNYRAIATSSNGSDSWSDLAQFYLRQHRLDDMENAIQHVLQAKLDQPSSLVESAEMLLTSGRNFNAAIQLLRQYLSNAPVEQAPKAHYLLGTLLEKQGDKDAAAQEYRSTLSIARSFSSAQLALSRLNH